MKKYLLLLLAFSASCHFAQTPITITSANMPGSGDTMRYSIVSPQGFSISFTGANVFWNFDTIQSIGQDVYRYKSSLQTPYAFYFLGLNQYGLKVADTVGFGTFQFLDVYNFFKKTNTYFSAEGTGFKYQGIPLASQYSDDDEIYTFPLNYGDHDSTTYSVTTALGATISYAQKGYRINDVDGWGTVKTPYDSVKCIRVVSTSYGVDSINFNGFGFSFPNVQRSYKWLSLTEKIPVLEVSGTLFNGNFNANQVRYRDVYQVPLTSLDETIVNENNIYVFPNPAKEVLYIQNNSKSKISISLYDMRGAVCFKNESQNSINEIKLNSLPTGVYQVVVSGVESGTIITKKIISE
jgi:Secretion system C-terminal sorting domain